MRSWRSWTLSLTIAWPQQRALLEDLVGPGSAGMPEAPEALAALALVDVLLAGLPAQDLPARRDLVPLQRRLAGLHLVVPALALRLPRPRDRRAGHISGKRGHTNAAK